MSESTVNNTSESPPLDFEAWARLSARLSKRTMKEQRKILKEAEIDLADWDRCDQHWNHVLSSDLAEGELDRARIYGRICTEDVEARRKAAEESKAFPEPAAPAPVDPPPAAPPISAPSSMQVAENNPTPLPAAAAPAPPPMRVAPPPPVIVEMPAAAPALGATLGLDAATSAPAEVLPFGQQHSEDFLADVVEGPKEEPAALSGSTLGLPGAAPDSGAALPFAGAPNSSRPPSAAPERKPAADAPGAESVHGFTVQQYASLWAEIAVYPDRTSAILARYGLPSEEAHKKLNDAWATRFIKNPALRRAWMELCTQYRDYLMQQKR